jgi:beta-lactam-binding protein with PASTA domain
MRISGSVRDAKTGAPLSGVRIYGSIGELAIFDTRTDARGDFNYRDQRTQYARERMHVRAEHAGYATLHQEKILPPGELKLDFELSKPAASHATISGSIRAQETGSPITGAKVTGSLDERRLFTVETDEDGRFRADLEASLVGQLLTLGAVHAGCAPHRQQVRLSASGPTVDIELRRERELSVTISGVVRARDTTNPVRNAIVTGSIGSRELFRVETNGEGQFFFSDNDRALAGQALIIEVEHPTFEPHIEHTPIRVPETPFEIGLKPLITIPQLKGRGLDEATRTLSGIGLNVGSITRVPAPEQGPGTVVATTPLAGQPAGRGSRVDLSITPERAVVPERVPRQTPRRATMLSFIAAGAAALILALLAFFFWPWVQVPNVIDRLQAAAEQSLQNAGLKVQPKMQESDTTTAGRVVDTFPSPGETARKGSTVILIVASSVRVAVPAVVGQLEADARSALDRAGLKAQLKNEESETTAAGNVISASPAPGQTVDKGSTVILTVALAARVAVPAVVGQSEADARSVLDRAGLKAQQKKEESETTAAGKVISASPAPGQTVDKGSTVTLSVATPARVAVPSVVGQSEADALAALDRAGLKAQQKKEESETAAAGKVISASPSPGQMIDKGSTVTLSVAMPARVAVPAVVGRSETEATAALTRVGLKAYRQEQPTGTSPQGTVTGIAPSPGGMVDKGSTVTLVVAVPVKVTVPAIVGWSERDASSVLGQARFKSERQEQPSETTPAGHVISTSPSGGQLVDKGSTVTWVVAVPVKVTVPAIVGWSEPDAFRELRRVGLKWERQERPTDRLGEGTVISLSPSPGQMLEKGASVTLVIGGPLPSIPSPGPPSFGAIAWDRNTGSRGRSWNQGTPQQAEEVALSECGASGCKVVMRVGPAMCGALALTQDGRQAGAASRKDRDAARAAALEDCGKGIASGSCIPRMVLCNR